MQYESTLANGFRDIIRKRNTDARRDMVMTISPAPTSWAGDKKDNDQVFIKTAASYANRANRAHAV